MPVSAYVQSAIFLILAAVSLFAAAGTIAILGFWLYLAILAAIIVASLLALDPGLLRERMRPGGQRPPLGLRLFTIVMFLHIGSWRGSTAAAFIGAMAFRHGYRPSA
jgi:hypothetical protein